MQKIIHQIWVGQLPPPTKWMKIWPKHNPDWEYRVWTNDDLCGNEYADETVMLPKDYKATDDLSLQEMLKEEPPFFSTSDELVVTPLGKKILQELYPVPSRYEKSGLLTAFSD